MERLRNQISSDLHDDIGWSINPQRDNLEDLLIRMREFSNQLAEAGNIRLSFKTDVQENAKMNMILRKNIFLIFKETFINALKHAACKSIDVELTIKKHLLYLSVTDDGKGIGQRKGAGRNGLKNMVRRAEAINGQLVITSVANEGTTIQVYCPAR
jgi:signal transduction histidine kinase